MPFRTLFTTSSSPRAPPWLVEPRVVWKPKHDNSCATNSPSRLWLTRIVTRDPRYSYSFMKYSMRPCQKANRMGLRPSCACCSSCR